MSKKQFAKWLNTPMQDDPAFDAGFDEACKVGEIEDEEAALKAKLDRLRFHDPDVAEMERIEARLTRLAKEKAAPMGGALGSTKHTGAQERQVELIEKVRGLMQGEIESRAWPTDKQGKEGLLRFVWRRHKSAIEHAYGKVEYDTVRRKTTPEDCKNLGLEPLPK